MKLRIFAISVLTVLAMDIASLVLAGQSFGVIGTLLLVVADMVLGARLLRTSGASLAALARGKPRDAKQASEGTVDGIAFGVAGALLMLPGFFSDLIALGLLLPWTRAGFGRWLEKHMIRLWPTRPDAPGQSRVIEGEAIEVETRHP